MRCFETQRAPRTQRKAFSLVKTKLLLRRFFSPLRKMRTLRRALIWGKQLVIPGKAPESSGISIIYDVFYHGVMEKI
jgi:hypothetical protein